MRKRVRVSYRSYAGGSSSPWSEPREGCIVPFVRLSGAWLHHHGFPVGAAVEVEAEPGRLVLRVVAPEPEQATTEPVAEAA